MGHSTQVYAGVSIVQLCEVRARQHPHALLTAVEYA